MRNLGLSKKKKKTMKNTFPFVNYKQCLHLWPTKVHSTQ